MRDLGLRREDMGRHFTKFYLEGLPVAAVLHRFTEAEPDADPHDHPWGFTSFVVSGGYVEEVFERDGGSYAVNAGAGGVVLRAVRTRPPHRKAAGHRMLDAGSARASRARPRLLPVGR